MFLKYTKAKIQAVLHCLFHGVTLQHIRIFVFQKKKIDYRLFEDPGEQSVEALPSQSPWPWSDDTPRNSLITLILNNRAGCRASWEAWNYRKSSHSLLHQKRARKILSARHRQKKSKIMTSHHLSSWPNALKVHTNIKQNHNTERFKNCTDVRANWKKGW